MTRPQRRLSRRWLAVVGVALGLVVSVGPAAAASPTATASTTRRVLIVSLPRVTWNVLSSERPQTLMRFLDRAAVASMSVRTVGSRTDPGQAYLTIGAGNRADRLSPLTAGAAYDLAESTPSGTAEEVYRRRTGIDPTGRIVVVSIAEQIARNQALLYGAIPGSLAGALAGVHRTVGSVGNADQGALATAPHREVALSGMDRVGQLHAGEVSDGLLVDDPLAPFGVRTDVDALVSSVRRGWDTTQVQIVEMSDLERAEQARSESTASQGNRQFAAALKRSDAAFARLLRTVDLSKDLVMVVGPTAPLSAEQLTVFGMGGPGVERGWARSATTRRSGFVTLTDIAPTVLDRWDVNPPASMNDTPISASASTESLPARMDTMTLHNRRALFRDDAMGPVTVVFIVMLVLLLLSVMAAFGSGRRSGDGALRIWALSVIAAPSVVFLSGLMPYDPFTVATYVLSIAVVSVLLAAASERVRRWDAVAPPVLLAGLAVAVIGVDVVFGGWLQLNTPFGYSPIVAGRFAGYGNQAFSIITIAALMLVTGGWEIWRRRRPGSGNLGRAVVAGLVFLAVVVLDGAPIWGSDVGGIPATVPAFTVCMLLLLGVRVRIRLLAAIAGATAAVLVVFAAVDLARPVDQRTHLGRFAQKLVGGEAGTILARKVSANADMLTSTIWTLIIPIALLFIVYLTWRPNGLLRRLNAEHPEFRAFGISGLTVGILGGLANDSGVAIPAMMLAVALPYTAYLLLGIPRSDASSVPASGRGPEGDRTMSRRTTRRDDGRPDGVGDTGTGTVAAGATTTST